jgi:hypothetical protein
MSIARTAIAAAAIVLGPSYLLFAQQAAAPGGRIGILLAAGDVSWCGDDKAFKRYPNKNADIIRQVIKDAAAENPPLPVRVLALGDLAYEDGTEAEFDCFHGRWGGFYDVMLPVPGNHEHKAKNPDGAPYFNHFKKHGPFIMRDGKQVPLVASVKGAEGEDAGYYAVNFPREDGPWRLIALNAYAGGTKMGNTEAEKEKQNEKRRLARKAQLEWLTENVDTKKKGNDQNCLLAFWHPPTFTSGRHGHVDYKHTKQGAKLAKVREMKSALEILYRNGASVVLAGHEHNYEQFKRHDADGKLRPKGGLGLRSFVVGTGGTNLTEDFYDNKEDHTEGLYGMDNGSQGMLQIDLFENRYEWKFLSIEKEVGKEKSKKLEKKVLTLKSTKEDCTQRPPA